MGKLSRERQLEVAFITIFSVLVLLIFYTVVSMNGVVLGNDPAVHLVKAQIFLQTGKIPLENLGWTPPLYELLLSMLISFSGATGIGQMIFLVKALAAVVDWLLFMAVYLMASKFFGKKVGAVSAVLLLMCFPVFEANQFGGYTTVLGIAFILFVLLYLTKAVGEFGYLVVTFLAAFALVLSHQLAAFLAAFMLPPILIYMVIKSRGASLKVVLALIVGGGIAFLYYFKAMFGYIGLVIEYVFFAVKTYAFQIPSVSFHAFIVNFGFIFFLALGGIGISYFVLRKEKKGFSYAILMISFLVPLFFAESYLFGFFMPFQWFIYYLTPAMAIFAGVSVVFLQENFLLFYLKKRMNAPIRLGPLESNTTGINGNKKANKGFSAKFVKAFRQRLLGPFRRNWLKILTASLIVLVCLVLVFRSDVVYGKMLEASVFYSTTDVKALDAGIWLQQNYPNNVTVVDTDVPGFWFSAFSGKNVIAQTSATVETNDVASSVLSLSYDIQDPQNLFRAYEAYGNTFLETYISIDGVWDRVISSSTSGDFISFTQNGKNYDFSFSNLTRDIYFDQQINPTQLAIQFSNEYVMLTETMIVQNYTYPANISWTVTPLNGDISNVTLYLTNYFDLHFDKAQIPQIMNWVNPWNVTSNTTDGNLWAVVNLPNATSDSYVGVYDDQDQVACAFNFTDRPDWGNIGALGNGQIDAIRFQYQFSEVNNDQMVQRQYQILCLSKSNFTALEPTNLESLLDFKSNPFNVYTRSYKDYIAQNNIDFIVYDKNQLDPNIIHLKFLQQIYSNNRYVIFKIISNYNQTQ
ncbi:MAG: ArnT family glycosyltransferase [Candidatus Bathyarchaeia archaeon]